MSKPTLTVAIPLFNVSGILLSNGDLTFDLEDQGQVKVKVKVKVKVNIKSYLICYKISESLSHILLMSIF